MKTSDAGLEFIEKYEGCILHAYPDPATGGDPWTIGIGHTGPEVCKGNVLTREAALELLRADVLEAERCINEHVNVPLKQHQFDALVSFIFNLGCGNFKSSSLLKLLNSYQYEDAAAQFQRWNKAAGKVMAGLTTRREAEATLFLKGG